MKTFVGEALKMLGGEVRESTGEQLFVSTAKDSQAEAVLGEGMEHLLEFSMNTPDPRGLPVVPGSRILDDLNAELSKTGSARHGLLPDSVKIKRRDLKNMCQVFVGEVSKFSVRSSWKTTVRSHFKITTVWDELVEELLCIEIPFKGLPRQVKGSSGLVKTMHWADRPPIKLYKFKEMLDRGAALAERIAIDRAEDFRKDSLKRLYSTLERLKCYYQLVKEESVQTDDENGESVAEIEYQRRKTEEVQQAGVRVKVEIVAVETISVPVKQLTWQLKHNHGFREVCAVFNCFDGEMVEPVKCEVCGAEIQSFGVARVNAVVCSNCYAQCNICGAEVVSLNAKEGFVCMKCSRQLCEVHSTICSSCREKRVCDEHVLICVAGCSVCHSCARHCIECGSDAVWCEDHSLANSNGDVTCREHAAYCIGCHEPYPSQKTETCRLCGQTVCFNCRKVCCDCEQFFCLNHIKERRCLKCTERSREKGRVQMKLF